MTAHRMRTGDCLTCVQVNVVGVHRTPLASRASAWPVWLGLALYEAVTATSPSECAPAAPLHLPR
jgi:hypothetical protein